MRNSAARYNPLPLFGLSLLVLAPLILNGGDQALDITSEDMVAIRSDEAWEDIKPDTIHFNGNFEMRIREMILNAQSASLYGKLESPDRLVLQGSPARFTMSRINGNREEEIQAEALEIIYERDSEWIFLNGDARLALGESTLRSIKIEYNIRTDRFRTQNQTGVVLNLNNEG